MADGQQITTFDDLNKSLAQYRVQKQPKPVQATALQPPPKAPSVGTTAVQAAPAAPKTVATPKPPKEAQPQVLSFDSLTKELNARRAQTGMQPVKPVEPKVIQLSPEEKGRQLTETGERALAWQQRQSERLGDFVASKMTATPEEIKKTLDNTPAWQVHLAHALFSPGTKYDETQYRREAQAGLELEQKLVGWADKKVVEFFTDPVNVAFMVMTGGTEPLLKVGINGIFTTLMAKGAYQGFHAAYQYGKAANWDVFAHVGADGHLEARPEAAPFWDSVGGGVLGTVFAGMGLASLPHEVGIVREYGSLNDSKITGIDKPWVKMTPTEQDQALRAVKKYKEDSKLDWAAIYADAEEKVEREDREKFYQRRMAQAQRHMDALAKADATIAGAPEKAHRDVGTAVPELPPDESGSPESREALRKLQMGEELTPAEKAIGERERVRSQILLNLEPEQTAGLSDKDFQRWSRQYSQEKIVDGDDLLKLVKSTVARGDIDGAERSLKRGIRWSSEDPSEIPDDVADTPSEKREKAKANAERNTKLSAKIAEAERIVERAKTAKKYELAPVPVLGEMSVPTKSKIWTPEGEREITVMKPAAAEAGNRDLAVLNPSDREYARQQGRERDARAILEAERQRRQQEYVRKAQQAKDDTERQRTALQDSIKRTAEERVKAAESGLKVEEKRPLRFRTEEAARFGEMERQLSDQMLEVANRNMFVTPEQYLRFLRRPNRDQPLTEDERDFLRMDEERKILQHYQDPANLPPVATGVGAAVPPTAKPSVPTMRDRLEGVSSLEEARQVLDGATDANLSELMVPLNRSFAEAGSVYGRAGERPLFGDRRGDLHEGSSWTPHQGVDVMATLQVHPEDLPKWAIPGLDGKFVLQVVGEGDGVFGSDGYTAPQIVVGKVDPAAARGNWDWTDWAAMEQNRRNEAFLRELDSIDRQNELENASIELGQQARRAGNTPEQAKQLEKDAQEADEMAKGLIEDRNREAARNQPSDFPESAPIKELGRGRETEIALPNGRRLKAHYALVSLDNVIASHLPMQKFEPNEDYIGWNDAKTMSILQPNDYRTNTHRQDETKYRAANPDFGQIFNTSSTGDQGPPVLRQDGIVAGGNNRTMVLEMLYASGRGNEVVNAIDATKDQFGITEATPPFEDSPAIVRVLDEPMESREELIDLGQQLNRDQMTKRNAAEDAAATALHFTPDFMDWIAAAFDDMDDEASLRDFMTKYATQIADKYEQYDIISHTERGQFIDENKEINPAGKLKFENAVRGVVIQDPASLAVLQEPGLRAQARAIDRALPGLLRMTAKGGIWDIHDYLPGAIRHWESINDARDKLDAQIKTAKEHGQKGVSLVDVYLYPERVKGTTRGFDFAPERPKLDPITEALMRLMELKPAEMKEAFNNYSLDAEGIHAQTNLLAEPLLPWASFDKHIGSKVGVEVQESDWGRIEAKPSEKPVEAAAVPPKVEEPLPAKAPEEIAAPAKPEPLEAPPKPPLAVAPEAGGLAPPPPLETPINEESLRSMLAEHPGITPAQREGMIQVWKAFAEKYQGVPFDQWIRDKWSDLKVGGEYKGQEGFQGDEKVVRGLTEFTEDGAAVMHLFEHANFSTFAHESFHIMRRYLKPEDLAVLEKHLKVKDGAWTAKAEEDAARSWERYLRDGEAPTPELKTLFAKLRAWMSAIYAKLKGTPLDIKVSADVRKVFDRMLTGEAGPEAPERKAEPLAPPPVAPQPKQEAPAGKLPAPEKQLADLKAEQKSLRAQRATILQAKGDDSAIRNRLDELGDEIWKVESAQEKADLDAQRPALRARPKHELTLQEFNTAYPEHAGAVSENATHAKAIVDAIKAGELDPDSAEGRKAIDSNQHKSLDEYRSIESLYAKIRNIYSLSEDTGSRYLDEHAQAEVDRLQEIAKAKLAVRKQSGQVQGVTSGTQARVIESDAEGNPKPGARDRVHATPPDRRDKVVKTAPVQELDKPPMALSTFKLSPQQAKAIEKIKSGGKLKSADYKAVDELLTTPGGYETLPIEFFAPAVRPTIEYLRANPGVEDALSGKNGVGAAVKAYDALPEGIGPGLNANRFTEPQIDEFVNKIKPESLERLAKDRDVAPNRKALATKIKQDRRSVASMAAALSSDADWKDVPLAAIQARDMIEESNPPLEPTGRELAEPPLPGFAQAYNEQQAAIQAHRGEELSGEIAAPKGDISRATGEMETKSPLFRGTEASPQNEMFAPLSPDDAKEVQESLGLPDKLFQDDSPQARDMKLRMIRDKLKMPGVSGELRRKLEAMQAQLQGEPHGGTTPETPTGAGKRSAEPIQPPPTAPEAKREVKRETAAPKKTVKIWTPHGEIEVAREEPRREAPPKADAGRGAVDVADRDQGTRVPEPLSERPQPTTRSDTEPPAGRGVRPPAAGGRGRTRPGTGEESLPDVTPTRIAPPKRERGVPIYAPEQWKSKLELFRLPENMPVPFVALDSDIARLLIFPGQKELAESALSGLKQHDAYILATATGTGKTYLSSAIISQIIRREKPKNVLVLTPSQNLVSDFKNVLLDFDVDAKTLPDGLAVPEQEGTYVTTFATANIRQGIETHPWDLVVMDEADAARRWYSSQQGAMAKKLGEHAGKVLYMSATPFHTALELGHMTKLGLWDNEGFDIWGKQFGIYRDKEGNYGGGNAPRKLVRLRQQLIDRGQFAQLDRNMEGYYPHFLLAPLSVEEKQGLRNIEQAFGIAKDYYARKGKKGLMRSLQGNMVVYMKSYLERTRLPQAIELAKRAEKEGYKAIIFSEHKTGRDELFSLLQEPDEHSDGEIKRLLPMIPDVVDELQKAFGDDIANFSGKHSTMRDEEKKAFIGNEKKHIYATYGAGGRGVSLHDTNGKHPRIAIYLGPPYSGVMLDQAIGRPWRFGTKSNVQAYFMLSNARDEVDLVIKKVAPRLESLRALVSGIDMTDPMTVAMRRLESAQDGAMGFDLGQEHSSNAGDLSNTYDNVPIMNWREAPMPPATEQMNKGMRLPGETMPHPGISRLMQSEEYELPADMELPESTEAKLNNDERAEDFAQGNGASELTQGELQSIPAPERVQTAESVQTLAEAAAKDSPEAPRAAVRRTWDNAGKLLKAAQDLPPTKAGRSVNWIWFTHGREIIRRAAARSGRPELGQEMARDIARYHVETGNVAGPFQSRYYDIAKKLTPEEHENMWLAKEGATRKNAAGVKVPVEPMNEKVVQAVKDTTKLLQDVKDLMARERIYTEFYDEDTGRRVAVPFAEQVDDPKYMPHRYDYERKITLVDPKTGAKETMTLREILKGKDLGQHRYERIVDAIAEDTGKSKAEIEDWLSRRRRDVPLVGNVERAREVDMPYYRTDPEAMVGYLEGAGEVVARQRVFGQDRMKLEAKLREIPNQRDRALIRDIFDSLLSRKQWDEDTRHFVNLAADWSVLSKMAFSAVKIPFHLLHSSLYTNGRTLLKTMFEGVTHPKEMRDRAIYSGAVMEQMRANLASELGMEKRFASKLLRWNLFHSAYSMDRALANASARIWMDDYALPKLKRDAQHSNARRQLKEVYLLGDNAIDKAAASGRWADEDYMRGGKALSDKVMFTFDPTELPPGWRARSNDPIADSALAAARVATLLKSFMFKTGVILKDRLWTEAKKGNFRPWLPFLAFYPVAGEAMRQLGGALTFNSKQIDWWQDPNNQDAAKILERTAEDIGYATGLTSLMWLVQAPLGQKGWAIGEFLAGPFYSDVMHTLYKFPSELAAAKSDYSAHNAITRWMTQTVPASRLPVRGYEEATGWDAEAEKKKAQKEAGHRAAQTRREHKYGNVKPL